MTDEQVMQLYRALLGRDPEDANTVAAFRAYYPSIDRGRRAILGSQEFAEFFARITGRTTEGRDKLAAALAQSLLARAAAAYPTPSDPPGDAERAAGMQKLFPDRPAPYFAVAIGHAEKSLKDLLPFPVQDSAILHVASGLPPAVPLTRTLDATTVFGLNADPASIAHLIQDFGRKIDALCLTAAQANLAWVEALNPYLAEKCLVLVGPDAARSFDPALSAAIARAHGGEPVQHWRGLELHHLGGWLLPVTYQPPATPPPVPDKRRFPPLAIACIVRNEAACVENMLRSAAPIASFMAVLDTGSQDATAALARACLETANIPHAVREAPPDEHADHFGNMRNAALAMVPDWIEWVLMLDADEELAPEDYTPILELAAGNTHDAYALPRYNFPGADKTGRMLLYPDRQTRLIRHTPDGRIGYANAVHEIVRGATAGRPPLDQSAMGGPRGGPHIHHLVRRFRTPEQEDRKQAFYKDIARRNR